MSTPRDRAADTLAVLSDSLETAAEGARATGNAVRDRGRDAARALARGERTLRRDGLPAATVRVGLLARRHAGKIAAAGVGLLTFLAVRTLRKAE